MAIATSDHWIHTDQGTLFARKWRVQTAPAHHEPAILLFHDSLGCAELWREFPERLACATGRSVLAYDRLGFGRSQAHPEPLALSFIADEAATIVPQVLQQMNLERVVPLGHSAGGAMAIATAAHLPERCIAVITESAQSFIEERTLAGLRIAEAEFERPGRLDRLARYHGEKARWVLDSWTKTWLNPAFANWRLDELLQRVHCPALAFHGDKDEYGSSEHGDRIARLVRAPSRSIILEQCGHIPHREQPARMLEEIVRFLTPDTKN